MIGKPAQAGVSLVRSQTERIRVRFHIIRSARIENVGKSQSCMVSKLRIIWKQTVRMLATPPPPLPAPAYVATFQPSNQHCRRQQTEEANIVCTRMVQLVAVAVIGVHITAPAVGGGREDCRATRRTPRAKGKILPGFHLSVMMRAAAWI